MTVTRRTALRSGLLGLGACASAPAVIRRTRPGASAAFPQGVASGDPRAESVVIWTRAAPSDGGAVRGTAEVAEDEDFERIAWSAPFEATSATDHTVKLVPDGLTPGARYHYRFRAGDAVSPTGRTRTLPERAERARFAVVSCSNYPFGHFHAYDAIAQDDFDAVIHLGDYLYEYGPGGYGDETGQRLGRAHEPAREITSLADYRQRHRQYKSDPGGRAMHAAHPLIAIWDDHETANNAWESGAENHDAGEGTWADRKRAALQAYYEYMPVRDPVPGAPREALFRDYTWGGLLTIAAIETRLSARSEQFEYSRILPELTDPEAIRVWEREKLGDSAREMLGAAQTAYLDGVLRGSVARGEPWRLVANQVIMAEVRAPALADHVTEEDLVELEKAWSEVRAFVEFTKLGLPLNVDSWDGYPAARERFYGMAKAAGARDLIVLTGDTHEFWANDLTDAEGGAMGVEIGTTGVTSPGPTGYLGDRAFDYSMLLRRQNPSVRWHGTGRNGYVDLTLDGDRGRAVFVAVSSVLEPDYSTEQAMRVDLVRRGGSVRFARPKGLGVKERLLFG